MFGKCCKIEFLLLFLYFINYLINMAKIKKTANAKPKAIANAAEITAKPKSDEKLDKANADKVGSDLALNSRTKYIYPADCNTPTKRKAFRTKFRKARDTAEGKINKLKKDSTPEGVKSLNTVMGELGNLLKARPDLVKQAEFKEKTEKTDAKLKAKVTK